jgi:hypothetical protein
MNVVFTNTKKSMDYFLNFFSFIIIKQDSIKQFIEHEFKPSDRNWAYQKYKTSKN